MTDSGEKDMVRPLKEVSLMKREVVCCDSCEKILSGGVRLQPETSSGEFIDLCPECLAEVLPEFSERTRKDVLPVTISDDDFRVLRGDDGDDEGEEAGEAVRSVS